MTECSHCRKRYDNGVRFCPVDGYAVVPVAEPLLGRTLMGQFQIQSVCGHGATGTVYRAMQVGIDREVAVKLLRADLLKDADVIKRFVREARAGARLNHPNIATVHMVGQTDEGVPFLVMEYVEGVPLSAVLGVGKPLPLRRIVHIGSQIASALAEAHGQGIVHRDLKPENILLSEKRGESDVVKVVDFGIAKMVAHAAPGEDPISRMGTVFGTPHYIAPEQASGQPVDGRADIYSLGCILFQMATGKVPFDGQQGLQVLLRQVRDPVPDPRSLNSRLSPALGSLILQMLSKDPAGRPQSAALLSTALKALDEEPGESGPAVTTPAKSGGTAARASGRPRPAADRAERDADAEEADWFQREAGDADRRDEKDTNDEGSARRSRSKSKHDADPPSPPRSKRDRDAQSTDRGPALRGGKTPPGSDDDSDDDSDDADRNDSDDDSDDQNSNRYEGDEAEARDRGRRPGSQGPRSGRAASGRAASARPISARVSSNRSDGPTDSAEYSDERALPFWQQHWKQLVGIGGAILLGLTAGLLYAYLRAPTPPATVPAVPPVPTLPPTVAPGTQRPAGPGPARPTPRPLIGSPASPAATPTIKAPDGKSPIPTGPGAAPVAPTAAPAPATGPTGVTPQVGATPPSPAPAAVAPAAPSTAPAAPTASASPAPAPATATPPPAESKPETKPETKPEAKPETKPEPKPDPAPAEAPPAKPAAPTEKPPEKPAAPPSPPEDNEASSDPYRRLH